MVVKKVMRYSPWAPSSPTTTTTKKKKYKVQLAVTRLEGLPSSREGGGEGGKVAAVEIRWKRPSRTGSLSYLMRRRRKPVRSVSREKLVGKHGVVDWEEDGGANICCFWNSELLSRSVSDTDSIRPLVISFSILYLVGWTPLIELKQIMRKDGINARLVGKIESYQPLSSVKDRSALRMIEDAEEKGLISPGITTLVEPTSGNLGIGLTYIAVQKGYKFVAVMPASFSLDKRILLRYLGAEVSLTDPTLGFQGLLDRVEQLKENIPNVYVLDQFSNAANPEAHFTGTGPEIWKDTAGKVDIFVCGSGSGGTLTGVGKYLKMKKPSVKIICVEPAESAVISGGDPGIHNIQGIGPGFIPQNLDTAYVDEAVAVSTAEAMTQARRLAREEGLLVGISSGANLAACLKVASREENSGKMIVTIFPSGGERYMSTELFDGVREECINMTF